MTGRRNAKAITTINFLRVGHLEVPDHHQRHGEEGDFKGDVEGEDGGPIGHTVMEISGLVHLAISNSRESHQASALCVDVNPGMRHIASNGDNEYRNHGSDRRDAHDDLRRQNHACDQAIASRRETQTDTFDSHKPVI